MKNMTKKMIRTGALALGMVMLAPMASAGEWRLNADRCPDIREDWRDMRRDNGWRDRREDRRDYRVINAANGGTRATAMTIRGKSISMETAAFTNATAAATS